VFIVKSETPTSRLRRNYINVTSSFAPPAEVSAL
jgi:hypothetical protein